MKKNRIFASSIEQKANPFCSLLEGKSSLKLSEEIIESQSKSID